jgi:L-lactate dehydrogenase complex protein LldF
LTTDFRARVRQALADAPLQEALDRNAERRRAAWEGAFATLPDAEGARREARRIRVDTLDRLEDLLGEFRRRLEENGVEVHFATTAQEACDQVVAIARAHGATRAAKSKSMISEEIGLNTALQLSGIEVVETDLGEFIVQLRGEPPAHIITPAIHLRRQDVGRTFADRLGVPFTTDVEEMTAVARRQLRRVFLEADVGISGVNFGVAETGTLCLITNEGNGRMVTTLPPVHIALMGMERLVPRLADLSQVLAVLPRAATGQILTSYTSLLQAPRQPEDAEGPTERHLILVDNGRLSMRASPLAEGLLCIRCGACLNACPVYQEIGGHAYGSVYPGPIGSVLSPALFGLASHGHLAKASTLCGACREACPVDIDLPTLLLRVRDRYQQAFPRAGRFRRSSLRAFAWIMDSPRRYRVAQRAAALGSRLLPKTARWIRRLPPPLDAWTRRRDFPPFAAIPFRERWESLSGLPDLHGQGKAIGAPTVPRLDQAFAVEDLRDPFERALDRVGGEVVRTRQASLLEAILAVLGREGVGSVLVSERPEIEIAIVVDGLRGAGVRVVHATPMPAESALRAELLDDIDPIEAGLTGVEAALAETGSLVLVAGEGRSLLPSLLPRLHIAVLPATRLKASWVDWLATGGQAMLQGRSQAVVITGPSRTADIEMTLTIGVHGPGKLVVMLVEDE